MTPHARIISRTRKPELPMDPVEFGERFVHLPKSAISKTFRCDSTPWLREPLLRLGDVETRMTTFIKPIQCGGSTVGEIILCYWCRYGRGLCLFNWETDQKAEQRWDERIDETLDACAPIRAAREKLNRETDAKCSIDFGPFFLRVQGAFTSDNLDSATARYVLNEEVHNWEPGHLVKSFGRTTLVFDHKIGNISNASRKGDQLNQCYAEGTMQPWEVKCPGCGRYHVMRTRWDDRRPELGGLRYNSEGCKLEGGRYDYNKLEPTIRYQFPCGAELPDNRELRRALSLTGRYAEPTNPGAHLSNRSYILEAVAVHQIPWLLLVREKHIALRARQLGDPEPWRRYVTERECLFYDESDVPILGRIVLSTNRKTRDGMPNRVIRFAAVDRQQGSLKDGEIPHWWVVIRDVDEAGNSLLVYEGKHSDDDDCANTIKNEYKVEPHHVVVDSGDDTTHVYLFCMKHGFSAIKGDGVAYFNHEGGARRIFSAERPLHEMLGNHPAKFDYVMLADGSYTPDEREPMFWLYSKHGIAERLHWLRAGGAVTYEIPLDVSEDYLAHQEAEELRDYVIPKTGERTKIFVQVKPRNDLLICERYIAMLMDMAGLIGAEQPAEEEK